MTVERDREGVASIVITRLTQILGVAVAAFCACAVPADSAVSAQTVTGAHGPEIVVENDCLKMVIEPGYGARIMSLVTKPLGYEIVARTSRDTDGMFIDALGGESWSASFGVAPYQCKVKESGPDRAVIVCRCDHGGPRPTDLSRDLRLTKTYTLGANNRFLQVDVRLENMGARTKAVGYWCKHDVTISGKVLGDRYVRPSQKGLAVGYWDTEKKVAVGDELVKQAAEGWTAALDPAGRQSLVFLMDYNYLMWLYNCLPVGTVEWFDDRVALPPGKAWETRIYAIPTTGLSGIVHASPYVLADCRVSHDAKGFHVQHALKASVAPLKNARLTTMAEEFFSHKRHELEAIDFAALAEESSVRSVELSPIPADPVILRMKLSGVTGNNEPVRDEYEVYYAGASKTGFVITSGGSPYSHSAPPKKKVFLKPDQIVWQPHTPRRMLYLAGLHHQEWQVFSTARKLGYQVDVGAIATTFTGTQLSFPRFV